jgi:anti-repressor protein
MDKLTVIENGIIPVYQSDKGTRLVNMRELHGWLGIETRFNDWINRRIEQYGFSENEDFVLLKNEYGENTGFQAKDYIFKLEPAKEIAMVESNEKGKEIRRYFIKVEEKYHAQQIDVSRLSPELQMFKQIFQTVAAQQLQVNQLTDTVATIKDTIITQPDNWREDLNRMFNKIVLAIGDNKFRDLRIESYKLLEERAHVDLKRRLIFYQARLKEQGASKTAADKANRLDVIEQDPKLREIYAKIVQEYTVKFVA